MQQGVVENGDIRVISKRFIDRRFSLLTAFDTEGFLIESTQIFDTKKEGNIDA